MENKRREEEEEEEKRTSFLSLLLFFLSLSSFFRMYVRTYVCMRMCASSRGYFRSFCDVRYRMVAVVATTTTTKGDEEDGDDKKRKEHYNVPGRYELISEHVGSKKTKMTKFSNQ